MLLAARPRTEAQMRDRLSRAGFADQVPDVLAWLRRLGYLDDASYARDRARALAASGRVGPRLAVTRLAAAGIPAAAARAAVREAMGQDELARCRTMAERRARVPLDSLDERARARLGRWLLGRGFSGTAVSSALGVYVDGGEER